MTSTDSSHKLFVLLFADIEGYTAMMQQNEARALEVIHKFNRVIQEKTSQFEGKIQEFYGDGYLISFESCTRGASCAIEMQKAFNQSLNVPVRIAVHLGDVMIKDGHAYGDGVNITSRIQSLGIAGAILVSRPVRDQIKNKSGFTLKSLGSYHFKNVDDPLEVFAIANSGIAVPDRKSITGKLNPSKKVFPWVWITVVTIMAVLLYFLQKWVTNPDPVINYGVTASTLEKPGQSYILSIGVDNNPEWRRLYNAENDALGVAEVLKERFGFQDLQQPLINDKATKDNILKAIDQAREVLGEEDELVVFFAGHGYSELGEKEGETPTGYIVPYDGAAPDYFDVDSYIEIDDFLKEISRLPSLHVTTIFDACYSGFSLGSGFLATRGYTADVMRALRSKSRKVFSSADFDQEAADNGPIAEHSLYSGLLIEGLRTAQPDKNNDGLISMNELAIYLEQNIFDYSPNKQTPRFGNYTGDMGGEMFLKYNPDISFPSGTVKDFIKSDKELYTVLPFRTSTPDERIDVFSTYLPQIVGDALSEYEKGKYKVIPLGLLGNPDSINNNTTYYDLIKDSEATKYFAGTYDIFGKMVIIKVRLYDASDHSVIYPFPDISGTFNSKKDLMALALAVKKRVKGFMDNNQQVIDRITNPPDIDAYRYLKSAYEIWCDDRPRALEYMDKAIETDSSYFRAYLGKAVIHVLCGPAHVTNALNEWEKFKDKDFDLTYYESERFKNLEYELKGNYEKLLIPKMELFRDFLTRSTFGDAIWYAVHVKDIRRAREMIKIVENEDIDSDFENDIFIWKNMIETFVFPYEDPIYYSRFKREQDLIDTYPNYYLYSKLFFDCNESCVSEIKSFVEEYNLNKIRYFMRAGDICSIKGQLPEALGLYSLGYGSIRELNEKERDVEMEIMFQYKLGDYNSVIDTAEKHMDMLVKNDKIEAIKYYLLANKKLNQPVSEESFYLEKLKNDESFPGFGYYQYAVVKGEDGDKTEALEYLKKAFSNGMAFTPLRYDFDPDLKPLWDDPEFIRFTRPKL